jgi:hypothetical protein
LRLDTIEGLCSGVIGSVVLYLTTVSANAPFAKTATTAKTARTMLKNFMARDGRMPIGSVF